MLDHIVQQYATSLIFTPRLMKHWKRSLEQKCSTILGITEMCEILVKSGKVSQWRVCFNGEYTPLRNSKYNPKQTLSAPSSYEPVELSAEKVHQLSEQHRKYIKQDVPHYLVPTFLQQSPTQDHIVTSGTHGRKRKGSMLSLVVMAAKKHRLSEKNCSLTAKKPRN